MGEVEISRNNDHSYCVNINNTGEETNMGEIRPGKNRTKKRKIVGLLANEINLLHLLDKGMVSNILEEMEMGILDEDATSTELLSFVMLNEKCKVIPDMISQLQYYNGTKWADTCADELYHIILINARELLKTCTIKEINIIAKVLEQHTGQLWFTSGVLKAVNANIIVKGFRGELLHDEQFTRRNNKISNPLTLTSLVKKVVLDEEYDVEKLRISLGTVLCHEVKSEWYAQCTVNKKLKIPVLDRDEHTEEMEIFAYPERDESTQLLLWRTFDYTHILTNMRSHILTRGYDFCKKSNFEWIVDNTTGVLSRYLVEYNMDSQNAFSTLKMFGDEVRYTLEANGMEESTQFVKLVKIWHMACDEQGLPADVRVEGLCNMHKFLTKNINFWSVPFQEAGCYIRGMTWQTFEALLRNISVRIQLYSAAKDRTYNACGISTLANESFFSDLVRLDKEGKGYPKASNVSKVMGRVVMLNYFKHKRNKNYYLTANLKPKYKPHLADEDMEHFENENEDSFNSVYRDHYFDYKDTHKSQRCRREDITTGLQELRGVRVFFKVNESKILDEVHAGKKPKGFTLE